ncbi:MAG: CDP-diacylglycerol--serine O-phosphatidyltransferase [Thermodesulfobacteriota bacterium]
MRYRRRPKSNVPPRKGFFLLPSLFTTASLLSGFFAIVAAIRGDFHEAALAILVSGVFDGLDGRIARLTNTTSKFGMEYDSLCDLVAFGVAPAILAYLWALAPYGRFGWLAAFLYVATTALRLARFNTLPPATDGSFLGLPCPAAAGTVATSVLFCGFLGKGGAVQNILVLAMVYFLSYFMVSTFRYLSFKNQAAQGKKPFPVLVAMVLIVMVLATEPQVTLFGLAALYVLSGPALAIYHWLAHGKDEPAGTLTIGESKGGSHG